MDLDLTRKGKTHSHILWWHKKVIILIQMGRTGKCWERDGGSKGEGGREGKEGGRMGEGRGGSRREMLGKDDDELLTIMA